MTFTEAYAAQPLTCHELVRLSQSEIVLTELVSPVKCLIAVMKSIVQHSKSFECSYDATFYETRVSSICSDMVHCGFLQDTEGST